MTKLVCLGLSILKISKIVMYEFMYDYVKPKYGEKSKFCYMDRYIITVYIKTEVIWSDIAKDVEKVFNTSNYELYRLLPKGNKEVIGLM